MVAIRLRPSDAQVARPSGARAVTVVGRHVGQLATRARCGAPQATHGHAERQQLVEQRAAGVRGHQQRAVDVSRRQEPQSSACARVGDDAMHRNSAHVVLGERLGAAAQQRCAKLGSANSRSCELGQDERDRLRRAGSPATGRGG